MELKELLEYRKKYFAPGEDPKILALGLASRKNLCIHPRVSGARAGAGALGCSEQGVDQGHMRGGARCAVYQWAWRQISAPAACASHAHPPAAWLG